MSLLALLLLGGCFRCGSYTFTSADGVVDGAFEECGPMAGSFAEVDGSSLLMALVPTADDPVVDEALVSLEPQLLVTIPDSELLPRTVYTADELYGTASAWVAADGQRRVANLAEGQLEIGRALSPNLLGEQRWEMTWELRFEGEGLTVESTGADKVDIVLDAASAGF